MGRLKTEKIKSFDEPFLSNHQKGIFCSNKGKNFIKYESCGMAQNGQLPNFVEIQ